MTIIAPGAVTPRVTVSGPGGYRQSLTATQTLTGLAPGNYTVAASDDTVASPVVVTIYHGTITGSATATVSAGKTASVGVDYAAQPGTGALWVATGGHFSPSLVGLDSLAPGPASPPTVVSTASAGAAQLWGVAFDASGNVWVSGQDNSTVAEFAVSQLATSGTRTPVVVLSGTALGSLNHPTGVAFDASGNLWVANYGGQTVIEFAASQLTASGSPTPIVTLSLASPLSLPTGLAFDPSGNLWVANSGTNAIIEFAASQLGASGAPAPAGGLAGGDLNSPAGLAFDAAGTLWVANQGANEVLVYSPSQLAAGGAPKAGMLTAATVPLTAPVGLAFDGSGDLWVSVSGASAVVEFGVAQLAGLAAGSSADLAPLHMVAGGFSLPLGMAFDPLPPNVPLK